MSEKGDGTWGSGWVKALDRLMVVYPPSFRRTLGPDMVSVFSDELKKRRRTSRWAAVRYGLETLLGAAYGGLREWVHVAWVARAHARTRRRRAMGGEVRQNLELLRRQMRKSPGFVGVVVLTLALGIGVTTGVFSVVRGVLLRPLPYPESGELVHLTRAGAASLPNIRDLGERMGSMEELGGAFVPSTLTLTGAGDPVQVQLSFVTSNFFRILGLDPAVGRWLDEGDVGTSRTVLSHALWVSRFGGSPGVVGRAITLNGSGMEVVGVAPPQIGAPFDVDVWSALPWGPGEGARGARAWRAVEPYGRLADGRSLDDARREMEAEWTRLASEYPDANGRWSVGLQTVKSQVTADEETPLELVFGAAGLFLLIACANVASLFLARLDARRREFAVRSALGASRMRLLRQVWSEALGLSVFGGIVGVGMATLGVQWALSRFGPALSRMDQVGVDGAVLAFDLGTALITAVMVSTVMVLAWSRDEPGRALRQLGRTVTGRTGFLRRSLVVGEVALALMMVTGLGLLVRSFERVQKIDVGLSTANVVVGRLGSFPSSRYPTEENRRQLIDRLEERMEAIPGVELAAVASHMPLGGCCSNRPFHLLDDPERQVNGVEVRWVSSGYFRLLGIPILAGRDLEELGLDDPTSVIINQVMARSLFGEDDPMGASVESDGFGDARVVGVSGSVREFSPEQAPPPMVYISTRQWAPSTGYLVLRTALPSDRIVPAVRAAVQEVDPLLPLDGVRTLDQVLAGYSADRWATTSLMALLGVLALMLGVVGIYGVMSHAVQGQAREIGVRLALGATRKGMVGRVLRSALVLVLPGLVLGVAGAVLARRFIRSLLYEVSPLDPLVYCAVLAVFVAAALASALGPARRASRTHVVEILDES